MPAHGLGEEVEVEAELSRGKTVEANPMTENGTLSVFEGAVAQFMLCVFRVPLLSPNLDHAEDVNIPLISYMEWHVVYHACYRRHRELRPEQAKPEGICFTSKFTRILDR